MTLGVPWPSSLARAIITRRLFLLHCLYGFSDGVQPYLTQVHIRFNFMEDWSPNWHFSTAMRELSRLPSLDDFFYPLERERSAIPLRNSRQIRSPMLQRNGSWSMPSSVDAVT
jgi:hypothetical protein